MKYLFFLSISALLTGNSFGQTSIAEKEFTHRDFQLTLFSPLGTNGLEGGHCINNFSVNLIIGHAAGVNGAEFGGVANILSHDMHGAQFSGFLNIVGGKTSGLQTAGFVNITKEARATQLSGFTNVVTHTSRGAQFAGFANFSANHSGLQAAGFANFTEAVEGIQIAGFLNVTQYLNGLQLGIVNIVDSIESGTPIGIVSVVKNGYNHWEFFISETMHANVAFKFGTSNFYNILAVGAGFKELHQKDILGIGYGAGHAFSFGNNQISLDVIAHQLMDMSRPFQLEKGTFNQLAQLKLTYDHQASKITYFGGPSFNVLYQQSSRFSEESWPSYAPYALYSYISGRQKVEMWIGLQAGIRF